MAEEIVVSIAMSEGKDIYAQASTEISSADAGYAVVDSMGMLSIAHGLGSPEEDAPASFQQFQEQMYLTTGKSAMHVYDGDAVVRAGFQRPAGELELSTSVTSVRKKTKGANANALAQTQVSSTPEGINQLFGLGTVTPFEITSKDVGRLVYMPSDNDFSATLGSNGPDYIGVIEDEDANTGVWNLNPNVTTFQEQAGATVADSSRMFFFDEKTDLDPDATDAWISALAKIEVTTPYGPGRPFISGGGTTHLDLPDGASTATSGDDACTGGDANPQAVELTGNNYLQVDGVDLVDASDETNQIGENWVVDFKCYLYPKALDTGGAGRILLWARRSDTKKSTWELSIVEGGKIEFRFWDTKLEDWRSIKTIGKCLTPEEWYYFRFRYKFKTGGCSFLDTSGGWEADKRWIKRGTGGGASVRHLDMLNNYRDGLWVWACERRNPADDLLVLPGVHNAYDEDDPRDFNMSQELGNTGMIWDKPWIAPERGGPLYTPAVLNGTGPVEWASPPDAVVTSTLLDQTNNSGDVRKYTLKMQMIGASGIYLPRWFSVNRDQPYQGDGKTQVFSSNNGNQADESISGAEADYLSDRAVLCYIFAVEADPGGSPGVYTELSPPRIFAVRHLGYRNSSDVLEANRSDVGADTPQGLPNSIFYLSDNPDLGADGLGDQDISAVPNGAKLAIAFALPNGENQSSNATGNTDPLPTLLVQGDNPVGVEDTPENTPQAPIYIGGAASEDLARTGALGFVGIIDDVGFTALPLVPNNTSDTRNDVYSSDHMAPDVVFHGPVDTRIGSLPPLQFLAESSYTGQLVYFDAITGASYDQDWAEATWFSRLDDQNLAYLSSPTGEASAQVRASDGSNQPPGTHRVTVTFYDPDRGHESPPAEEGTIEIEIPEDELANDAERRVVVKNIPISPDHRPRIWRRLYKTLADGSVFFLLHEIRDNRTKSIELAPSDVRLAQGREADFGFAEPPICKVIRASEDRMYFAGLEDAPNAVAFSDPFRPWQVPGTQRNVLESVEGNPVSALAYLDGRILAFKRDSYFVVDTQGPFSRVRRINSNTGAVSHHSIAELEDAAFFAAEKGVYMIDGTSRLVYVGRAIEGEWEQFDQLFLPQIYGAYHRLRNQYMFTGRQQVNRRPDLLFTGEVPDSPDEEPEVVWSKQVHPMGLTALITADDVFTDQQRVIMGTSDGFVGMLDVDNGVRGHEGTGLAPFDTIEGLTAGDVTNGRLEFSPTPAAGFDIDEKDGLAGVPFLISTNAAYTNAAGDSVFYPVFIAQGAIFDVIEEGGAFYLRPDRPDSLPTIGIGYTMWIGGWRTFWESKWFNHGEPVRDGETLWGEYVFDSETSGTFTTLLYENFDDSTVSLARNVAMDDGYCQEDLQGHSKYFKIQIYRLGNNKPLEIYFLGLRHHLEGQR